MIRWWLRIGHNPTPAMTPRTPSAYRLAAERCCSICSSSPGDGPWCGRCGVEVPETWPSDGGAKFRFRSPCPACHAALEAEFGPFEVPA